MKEFNLTEIIKENYVYFHYLRQGFAYYHVYVPTGETKTMTNWDGSAILVPIKERYLFTVPLDDIGNGTLTFRMKAIECMRWIRRAIENKEFIEDPIKNESKGETRPYDSSNKEV